MRLPNRRLNAVSSPVNLIAARTRSPAATAGGGRRGCWAEHLWVVPWECGAKTSRLGLGAVRRAAPFRSMNESAQQRRNMSEPIQPIKANPRYGIPFVRCKKNPSKQINPRAQSISKSSYILDESSTKRKERQENSYPT